jgi:hypothetical protein
MRLMAFALAAAMVAGSWAAAVGYAGCQGCGKSVVGGGAFCGPACSSPNGYTLSPGCCENTQPCCNNAWEGYCEHRAKVQAFWANVGTPRPCTGIFSPIMPSVAMKVVKVVQIPPCEQPTPAAAATGSSTSAPTPAPVPPKAPVEKK